VLMSLFLCAYSFPLIIAGGRRVRRANLRAQCLGVERMGRG